ncbi:MAG TPA: hypothetical protein VGL72_17490 [Bryobacteraceae bacterium]
MLTIRSEQMQALAAQQRLAMALRHVRQFFPSECAKLPPESLENTVRRAMARATHYGFTSLRDSLQFVDLAILFGPDFDQNFPWARDILDNDSGERACFRSARLYRRAQQHLRMNP